MQKYLIPLNPISIAFQQQWGYHYLPPILTKLSINVKRLNIKLINKINKTHQKHVMAKPNLINRPTKT